jgi:hypothetical protein
MKDWDAVVGVGLALPGVELGTTYGKPALKVRGKMIAATTAPEPGSFVLHVPMEDKAVLIETDLTTFWQTDHYHGWPAILVRYGTPETDRIAVLLARAWWDRSTIGARTAYGDRP